MRMDKGGGKWTSHKIYGKRENSFSSGKFYISSFQGKHEPDIYFLWEKKVGSIFNSYNFTEERRIRLALSFTDYAILWWNRVVEYRKGNGMRFIKFWEELKKDDKNGLCS